MIQMLEGNDNIPVPPNPFPEEGVEMQTDFLTKPTVYSSATDESIENPSQEQGALRVIISINLSMFNSSS